MGLGGGGKRALLTRDRPPRVPAPKRRPVAVFWRRHGGRAPRLTPGLSSVRTEVLGSGHEALRATFGSGGGDAGERSVRVHPDLPALGREPDRDGPRRAAPSSASGPPTRGPASPRSASTRSRGRCTPDSTSRGSLASLPDARDALQHDATELQDATVPLPAMRSHFLVGVVRRRRHSTRAQEPPLRRSARAPISTRSGRRTGRRRCPPRAPVTC
jgi:hypothetical protein